MYVGSISGLIVMNLVSDKKGRKFAFMISSGLTVVGATRTKSNYLSAQHWWIFEISRRYGVRADIHRVWGIREPDY
jgi:hypothetical protein